MEHSQELLRGIPKMDALLELLQSRELFARYSRALAADALRSAATTVREDILAGKIQSVSAEEILARAEAALAAQERPHQRIAYNATGVLLHTNLGRSLLAERAADAVREAAAHYTTLEFDCETGKRGDRYSHVEGLLCELSGCESALVVNNNAAAVLLALSALAKGREVVASRGELVEIGGSFRVPEVMEQSGCMLREVGATNKTRIADYRAAITENTAALLKVHTSNYRIIGFTAEATLAELVALGRETGLPVMHDLGSGALLPLRPYGVSDEPTVRESVDAGADVICFSGDKLLCGPQAGIILGRKDLLDQMKKHPLLRALRVDKLTLAALEATLKLYRDPALAEETLPLYRMLSAPVDALRAQAKTLCALLADAPVYAEVVETAAQIGGGSVPAETIPSAAASVAPHEVGAQTLCHRLLLLERPVVARIEKDRAIFDLRTLGGEPETLARVAEAICRCAKAEGE